MTRVAFLTAGCLHQGHPDQRTYHAEHERELAALTPACAAVGIELRAVVWDDPRVEPEAFSAFVIGSTWDYAERPDAFLAALGRFAASRPLFNPLPVVRWNLHKAYLADLAARGVPVVPSLARARVDPPTLAAAFDELEADELVVKPVIGSSAWRQVRVGRRDPVPPEEALPAGEVLIQPFLPSVTSEGESSLLFFDRVFCHAVRKLPAQGDYRVQSSYGGREARLEPSREDLDVCRRVIDAVQGPLLQARVDLVRDRAGRQVVMELELIEPYLYPQQGPAMGPSFARALERQLGGVPRS